MKVTNASELDPEVLSALNWIARVESSRLDLELTSSKMRGESDSAHSSELGSSHIHDQMSIIFPWWVSWVASFVGLEGVWGDKKMRRVSFTWLMGF